MTMTLGFDAHGYLEALLDADRAREVLVAIARHAPKGVIRAARYGANGYEVVEVDKTGAVRTPADAAALSKAIDAASYVDWPNDRAPEGVPPLIVPGGGWDLRALLAEPALLALIEVERFCRQICGTDRARSFLDRRGTKLLAVADTHGLLTVFR